MSRIPAPLHSVWGGASEGLVFGCDYNPEQWDLPTWVEDVRLMGEVGVNLVAINVFGWSHIEPEEGRFDFSDLDTVIALLQEHGIGVNLGTGTSSPPPWLSTRHPEILPMAADGTRRWPGGRQGWCPSSPVFREFALRLVAAVAERYGDHPAVKLWHVSNELGCHNALCYCDVSAGAFREWLRARYGSIDELNRAWGTAFWSQRYSAWDEILPPRATLSFINPAQSIDFSRFSSDELLGYFRAEADVLRATTSIPVTTNFMVTAHIKTQDYWTWADDMDVIANDHYLDHRLATPHRELSFSADLTRGLAGGAPWLLMENSTSAVNWQPYNRAKAPGEMMRNTVAHVARGADGVCFFQWRASLRGTEKFHSALLPHAGTRTRVWNEVVGLGELMVRLGEVSGSRVVADVALVFSWEAWWATDLEAHPSRDLRYLDQVHALYGALWDLGISVSIVPPGAPLADFALVIVPSLYLVSDGQSEVISGYVRSGGNVVVTFFSGIVDENDGVRPGGYPGAFRDMLGIRSQEFYPLLPAETVGLSDGSAASIWSELLETVTAEPVLHYVDGPLAGIPAVTRNQFGDGTAWYLATALTEDALRILVHEIAERAGVSADTADDPGVEVVRRRCADATWTFVINHTGAAANHNFGGFDLVSQREIVAPAVIEAGEVQVIRREGESA